MEMHFAKRKESNFVLERDKERENTGQNLKVKKKVLEGLWERQPEKSFVQGQDCLILASRLLRWPTLCLWSVYLPE